MPPRLQSLSAPVRLLARPFTTSAALALPPREHSSSSPTNRLSNLNSAPARGAGGAQRGEAVSRLSDRFDRLRQRSANHIREKQKELERAQGNKDSKDYLRQMPRRWQAGEVYSPHDLSPTEMRKWSRRSLRQDDVVDALGISPLDMYKNFALIEHFTSPSAMIKHSKYTRLRPVNQRKVAKMVRRVQGMGIYPTVHSHPEMIREQFFPKNKNS